MAAGNNVGVVVNGIPMGFFVGTDGTLCQSFDQTKQLYFVTEAGVFDPDSPLDLKRHNYDPAAGGNYQSFFIVGRGFNAPNTQVHQAWHPALGWWRTVATTG